MRREKDIKKYKVMYYRNKVIRILLLAILLRNFVRIVEGNNTALLLTVNILLGSVCLLFENYVCIMQQDQKETLIEEEIVEKERILFNNLHSLLHISDK